MSNYLRKIGLGIGALVLPYVIGCGPQPNDYTEGKIIKEGGTIMHLQKSSGALFGNESVKISDPTYVLTVETSNGTYTLQITNHHLKPVSALEQAIEEGDTISFPVARCREGESFINISTKDNIGTISSNFISIVRKAEKKKE
jgi:hypothetical protein